MFSEKAFQVGGVMVLGKLPVQGHPTNLDREGQGPTALAVGAGGGCLDIFFSHLSNFSRFSFSISLGGGLIRTEILSQRADKPKTINQSSMILSCNETMLFACTYLQSNHFIQKTCKIKDKILNRIQTQSKMMEVVKNTRNGGMYMAVNQKIHNL